MMQGPSSERDEPGHAHAHSDELALDHPHADAPAEHGHAHADEPGHGHPHVDESVEHGHAHISAPVAPGDHKHADTPAGADDHAHEHDEHGHDHADGADDHQHVHHSGPLGWLSELFGGHSHGAPTADEALEGSADGIRAVKVSLLAMFLTAVLQLAVVVFSGSVGLLADTIHNFADALTSIPLWIAFVVGQRAANRRYTYGYGRAEDVAGLAIVTVITLSAALAAWESIRKLLNPEPIGYLGWVMAAAVIGFIGNEAVAIYRIRVGTRIGSAALVADGQHARVDGLTSLAVLVGALGVWAGFPIADPLIGLVITLAIMFVLRDALREVWWRLMDAVDPSLVTKLEAAAHAPGVEAVNDIRVRWIGHTLHAEANVQVDGSLSTTEGHAIAEEVRHAMFHAAPWLRSVTVHVDPSEHDGVDRHTVTEHHTPTRGT
jgi:cation diffusion facilitator family transporter